MHIERQIKNGQTILEIEGRIDASTARHLEAELDAIIREGAHTVRLSFAGVDYISSAGLRTLMKYAKEFRRLDGSFGLLNIPESVRSILEMTGLLATLESGTQSTTMRDDNSVQIGNLQCQIFHQDNTSTMLGSILGSGSQWTTESTRKAPVQLQTSEDLVALGIGVLGEGNDLDNAGEFLALGGAAICQPSDTSRVPDYMLTEGSFVPNIHAISAFRAEGAFSDCIRFEPSEGTATLSDLLNMAFSVTKTDCLAVAFAAESCGLIGATLQKASIAEGESFFEHPSIRERLAFTAEPAHEHTLALVGGVAMKSKAKMPSYVRPLADGISGHMHATLFHFQALPKGNISLRDTVRELFNMQEPLAVMHLLTDDRPITGSGESHFSRGVLWVGPLNMAETQA